MVSSLLAVRFGPDGHNHIREDALSRVEQIGDATLYLGNSLEIMLGLQSVEHVICDPPYEKSLHDSKNKLRTRLRSDAGPDLKGLDFDSIDGVRGKIVEICAPLSRGWFIAFCTVEGTFPWAETINASPMKYKRACAWIKPDSTPQLNGQGPAQGFECFVVAWCGHGHARWNAGGKRGVYTHLVNNPDRQGEHPTEKPRRLMCEIVSDFMAFGDTICDPFMGSGTTGVAAISLGRKFIGIEREEKYFDIACRRIEAAYKQPRLFKDETIKHIQGGFEL